MTPDDPRHGTTPGYHAGCRELCCRRARARYEKEGRLARLRGGRAVPALSAQRRIRALMALGWSSEDIANAAGWSHRNHVLRIINGQKGKPCTWIQRGTDTKIRDVYDRMSMRAPDMTPYRRRSITIALRKGWAPPLAWDDIDNPDEKPKGLRAPRYHATTELDPVKVDRMLAGDFNHDHTTPAEKAEVVRRWVAEGRSLAELERRTGWNTNRYREGEVA